MQRIVKRCGRHARNWFLNESKKAVEVKRVLNNEKEETDPKKIANAFNDFFGGY